MEFPSSLIRQGVRSAVQVVHLNYKLLHLQQYGILVLGELLHQNPDLRIVMEFASSLRHGAQDAVQVVYIKLQQVLLKHDGFAGPTVQHWPDVSVNLIIDSIMVFPLFPRQCASRGVSPHHVMREYVWHELVAANLFNKNLAHLFFDMVSLLWYAVQLESRCGWKKFTVIVLVLWLFSRWLDSEVAAVAAQALVFGIENPVHLCLRGFSGLVFALKVLVQHRATFHANFFKIAMSVEMVVARVLLPQAYLTSYLCGILAGFTFVLVANVVSEAFGSSDSILRLAELPMDITVGRRRRPTKTFGTEEESDEDETDDEKKDGAQEETHRKTGSNETGNNETDDEPGSDETGRDEAGGDEAGGDEAGGDEAGGDEAGGDEAGSDEAGSDETDEDMGSNEETDEDIGSETGSNDETGDGNDEYESDESDDATAETRGGDTANWICLVCTYDENVSWSRVCALCFTSRLITSPASRRRGGTSSASRRGPRG